MVFVDLSQWYAINLWYIWNMSAGRYVISLISAAGCFMLKTRRERRAEVVGGSRKREMEVKVCVAQSNKCCLGAESKVRKKSTGHICSRSHTDATVSSYHVCSRSTNRPECVPASTQRHETLVKFWLRRWVTKIQFQFNV